MLNQSLQKVSGETEQSSEAGARSSHLVGGTFERRSRRWGGGDGAGGGSCASAGRDDRWHRAVGIDWRGDAAVDDGRRRY